MRAAGIATAAGLALAACGGGDRPPSAPAGPTPPPPDPRAPARLVFSAETLRVEVGQEVRAGVTVLARDGSPLADQTVRWRHATGGLRVDSLTGVVTGVALGDGTVTAALAGGTLSGVLPVAVGPSRVRRLQVLPAAPVLRAGDTLRLAAQALDSLGRPVDGYRTRFLLRAAADSQALDVTPDGLLRAAAHAAAGGVPVLRTVTAELAAGSVRVSVPVVVTPPALPRVTTGLRLVLGTAQRHGIVTVLVDSGAFGAEARGWAQYQVDPARDTLEVPLPPGAGYRVRVVAADSAAGAFPSGLAQIAGRVSGLVVSDGAATLVAVPMASFGAARVSAPSEGRAGQLLTIGGTVDDPAHVVAHPMLEYRDVAVWRPGAGRSGVSGGRVTGRQGNVADWEVLFSPPDGSDYTLYLGVSASLAGPSTPAGSWPVLFFSPPRTPDGQFPVLATLQIR